VYTKKKPPNVNTFGGLSSNNTLNSEGVFSIMGAGNSADANLALACQNVYSDVVLNVPLIRPNRALIPEIRSSWPAVGVASQRPKREEEPS
jgi:hypothetical protein